MKKYPRNQLYPLNQAAEAAAGNKKTLFISAFFFLTGIFTGLFLELIMSPEEKSNLSLYLQQYILTDSGSMEYPDPFFSSLATNLLLLLIIFLAGLSIFGFPAAMAALAYKGTALGFCTGLIAETLKNKGVIVILTSLLPQNLLLIPAFILAASAAINYALFSLSKGRRPSAGKKSLKEASGSYVAAILILAAAIGLACGLESALAPAVL